MKKPHQIRKEAMALLQGIISPSVFNEKDPKPLKVGILKNIFELIEKRNLPVSKRTIRRSMFIYTRTLKYLKSFEKYEFRYDLDGNPSEPLSKEEKEQAMQLWRETKAKLKAKGKNIKLS